ncbi:MAG TPA: hypothetical protein VGF29_14445 [Hyphomicrobiaceae bacterium]|jgi:hypothetical protein
MDYRQSVFVALVLAVVCALASLPASAQVVSLKNGETAQLGTVYWVANCKSLLKSFAGVDVLEAPSGVSLSIKKDMVYARRQNCPEKVPGGIVMATAKGVKASVSGALKYRVRYNTLDGPQQSSHSVTINLYP